MNTASSTFHFPICTDLLGVRYFWRKGKPKFNKANLDSCSNVTQKILEVVRGPMQSQKRGLIAYWDAITYLEQASLPQVLAQSTEALLACELIVMLGHSRPRDHSLRELIDLPLFDFVHSNLAYDAGEHKPAAHFVAARTDPDRVTYNEQGQTCLGGPGYYRLLAVDMDALGMPSTEIDWHRLIVFSVLIQLRADFEIYYETGFMPVRKCQHRSCGAWFKAKRMAGRQRFCSTNCRVAHSRTPGSDPAPARRKSTQRKTKSKRTKR